MNAHARAPLAEHASTVARVLAHRPTRRPEALVRDPRERVPLPHRAELERRFGISLDRIEVYAGPRSADALTALRAESATVDGVVLLPRTDMPVGVVAHEVAHALQARTGAAGPAAGDIDATHSASAPRSEGVEPAGSLAEREATAIGTAAGSARMMSAPVTVSHALAPGAVALLRRSSPLTDLPASLPRILRTLSGQRDDVTASPTPAPTPASISAPATTEPALEADEQTAEPTATARESAESATPPRDTPAPVDGGSDPDSTARIGVPSADPEQTEGPALALREAPIPDEAALAASREAAVQARAAIASAATPAERLRAFAAAPPTVKAQEAAALVGGVAELTASDAQHAVGDVPAVGVDLAGSTPPASRGAVATTPAATVELSVPSATSAPAPVVAVVDVPDRFTPRTDASAPLALAAAGEPQAMAARVEESLSAVQITDPAVPRSAGARPAVPLGGETDPHRVAELDSAARAQVGQLTDAAASAVTASRGAEAVQPAAVAASAEIGQLEVAAIPTQAAPAGPAEYAAMNLPPEVQASFDQQQAAAMEQSLVGAVVESDKATAERDTAKQAAVDEAKAGEERLRTEAGEGRSHAVEEARRGIGGARRTALDQQKVAVASHEGAVAEKRREQDEAISGAVSQGEQQIEGAYIDADGKIGTVVGEGERKAAEVKAKAERDAENESWWDRAVSWVKSALKSLVSAVGAIFDGVRALINKALDAAKALALRAIDAVAGAIKGAIGVFGAILKGAISVLVGQVFPELAARLNSAVDGFVTGAQHAVDAVADRLKKGVEALVEGLRTALMKALDVFQAGITAALSLATAALTGDWGALARMVLEAVLRLIGVSPAEFAAFVGSAEETFRMIVDKPMDFVRNLMDAVKGGISGFAERIGTHLQQGVIGWLTGALGSAGITIPEKFDLMGVLDLARQILGLTWENLKAKARTIIGEKNVERLETAFGFIGTLVTEGWSGLWNRIIADLTSLRDTVFDGIRSFVQERVIFAAITKLASLFNPVGAIVQLVLAAWNLFTFVRDQLSRLVELVTTVVGAVGDIARGILDKPKAAVEGVLSRLLPLAIDLLARLLGLGNVGAKVREIIEKVRGAIDKAIDKLIGKVVGLFSGGKKTTDAAPGAGAGAGAATPAGPGAQATVAAKHAVKQDALTTAAQRLREANLESPSEIDPVLESVFRQFRAAGLLSLSFRVTDEKTLTGYLVATASEGEKRDISWRELFGKVKIDDLFKRQGFQTHAALSLNGRMVGESMSSDSAGHAEENVIARHWDATIAAAGTLISSGTAVTIGLAINRAPCPHCTALLIQKLNAIDPRIKSSATFILAPLGIYEPKIALSQAEIEEQIRALEVMANVTGRSLKTLIKERLVKVDHAPRNDPDPKRRRPTIAHLRSLSQAGWDIHKLKTTPYPTVTGKIMTQTAHTLAVEAGRAKAGTP